MAARQYRSTVEAKTLSTGINSSIGSMTVNNGTTLPNVFPYTLVIDPDLSTEEIVTVTSSSNGGATLAITRGQDGTSGQSHNASAIIKHMVTARDLQDAQNHIEASSGGYTIINDGNGNTTHDLHGIASGEGSVVGTSKTQTLTNKTINLSSNTLTGTTSQFNSALSDGNFATVALLEERLPTGSVTMWVTGTAPTGWLLCQGQAVSRTTYSDLFTVVGTTYGVGDNSTTFNLPDFLGRVPMGAGTGTGLTGRSLGQEVGVESVTLTSAQSGVPAHDHGITSVGGGGHTATGSISTDGHGHPLVMEYSATASHDHAISGISNPRPAMKSDGSGSGTIGNYDGTAVAGVGALGGSASVSVANHSHDIDVTVNTAANAAEAHTNIQPSTVINFIIKH